MSPFFRGSVRLTKKHPRPWSLNPRLNPDLAKDEPRMSILGLPSTDTDVTLPVFNSVNGRTSLKEPLAITTLDEDAQNYSYSTAQAAIIEEDDAEDPQRAEADVPADSEKAMAETVGVAEIPSGNGAPAGETSQPAIDEFTASPTNGQADDSEAAGSVVAAPTAEEEKISEVIASPSGLPALDQEVDRSVAAEDADSAVEVSSQPAEAPAADSPNAQYEPEQVLAAEGAKSGSIEPEFSGLDHAANAGHTPELFSGSLSAETLPAIDEATPEVEAAAEEEESLSAAEPVDPAAVSVASGLESIAEISEPVTPGEMERAEALPTSVEEDGSEVAEEPHAPQAPAVEITPVGDAKEAKGQGVEQADVEKTSRDATVEPAAVESKVGEVEAEASKGEMSADDDLRGSEESVMIENPGTVSETAPELPEHMAGRLQSQDEDTVPEREALSSDEPVLVEEPTIAERPTSPAVEAAEESSRSPLEASTEIASEAPEEHKDKTSTGGGATLPEDAAHGDRSVPAPTRTIENVPEVHRDPTEPSTTADHDVPADEEHDFQASAEPLHDEEADDDEDENMAVNPAVSGIRNSFAGSASADGSVATHEEPLMTDEQLEVSDEFRPGVKSYALESSQQA